MIYETTSAYINFVFYSEVLGRCSNLSLYMYVSVIFFPRFKNRDTGDNRGADFQNFLQPRNFADPRKTVIPGYSN